jgi:hypothetical protein
MGESKGALTGPEPVNEGRGAKSLVADAVKKLTQLQRDFGGLSSEFSKKYGKEDIGSPASIAMSQLRITILGLESAIMNVNHLDRRLQEMGVNESADNPAGSFERVNEGYTGYSGVVRGAKSIDDAVRIVKTYIGPDGSEDMANLRGVKVVTASSGDDLSDTAEKKQYENQYAVVAEIDGEFWYAYSARV